MLLKLIRESAGLSIERIAGEAGEAPSVVRRFEAGHTSSRHHAYAEFLSEMAQTPLAAPWWVAVANEFRDDDPDVAIDEASFTAWGLSVRDVAVEVNRNGGSVCVSGAIDLIDDAKLAELTEIETKNLLLTEVHGTAGVWQESRWASDWSLQFSGNPPTAVFALTINGIPGRRIVSVSLRAAVAPPPPPADQRECAVLPVLTRGARIAFARNAIRTIGDLKAVPVGQLFTIMGSGGRTLLDSVDIESIRASLAILDGLERPLSDLSLPDKIRFHLQSDGFFTIEVCASHGHRALIAREQRTLHRALVSAGIEPRWVPPHDS